LEITICARAMIVETITAMEGDVELLDNNPGTVLASRCREGMPNLQHIQQVKSSH
jgi:hypothetical protein